MPPVDLLCIAAHRDDAELTCGGTLIKAVDDGYRVGVLDLTEGEMGTRGSADLRAQEAEAAAEVMGLTIRENLRLPDAGVENTRAAREALVAMIRQLQPRVVIAPAARGRHPDHRLTSELVRDACFLAGIARYVPDVPRHRPLKLLHTITYREDAVKPTFVVDISAQFERKLAAIRCYASQFDGQTQAGEVFPNGESLYDIVTHQAAHYGARIRCRYGEPFYTDETMRVTDVLALDVSTF
ncbi:MAG: bacillithiol biosynthesis deacetylase BshB1 [Gemmatimonadaceae bacterium]|nr:bacillithiol biosynthesis deacetylase BshB1 [Gemmatimonadaceae bacterium]